MLSFKGEGERISVTAGTAGRTSGDVVVVRTGATGMIGVSLTTVAASAAGMVAIEGVFSLVSATGTTLGVFAVGDIVYWDIAGGHCNSQASANVKAGICMEASAAAAVLVKVKLLPSKA